MAPSITSPRPKVVLTRDLGPDSMSLLQQTQVVVWSEDTVCDKDWLLQNVPGAIALIVLVTDKIDAEILDAAGPQLRVVSIMAVGYDSIDVKELAKRNIKLGYTPEVLTNAVADVSVMLAFMASRNVRETMAVVHEGKWPQFTWSPFLFCGFQLSTSGSSRKCTAGFVGFGRIAQATLARLIPFGFRDALYASRPSSQPNPSRDEALVKELGLDSLQRVSLDRVASESDVVFVLTPGGSETKHLISEDFLRKMKKTSVLVNTCRGTVVDSDALAKALHEGWIWGAGLDVVAGEPNIPTDHPLVKEPRCVMLPHIGSATFETRVEMAKLAIKNALAVISGETMSASVDLKGYF
ncbi:D-isomer specific 2-hydroxyacid dehydrogenase [Phlegmacium glaucopus]|nr:D-isomer specific 2-hydroxyacid dehydrogenase [Phlegmacium glaucopus]